MPARMSVLVLMLMLPGYARAPVVDQAASGRHGTSRQAGRRRLCGKLARVSANRNRPGRKAGGVPEGRRAAP